MNFIRFDRADGRSHLLNLDHIRAVTLHKSANHSSVVLLFDSSADPFKFEGDDARLIYDAICRHSSAHALHNPKAVAGTGEGSANGGAVGAS